VTDPNVLLSLAGACAVLMVLIGWFSRRNYLGLPELPVASEADLSGLSVIIPARNEAANIERAVSGLRQARVLVVDDHSSDGTRELAAKAGAEVMTAPPLQRHWRGKPNACWAGAQATNGKWLLFADADTWYEPRFLPSLLAYATRRELNVATVFPRQVCLRWFERLLLPYAFGLYFAGVNPRAVNNPASQEALANGQSLLFRRDAYNFIGGHRSVMGSVIEDVELARRVKRHRMNVAVMRAEHLASVRMYDSFGALWRGFEKNSFRFLRANPATGVLVMLASIVMASWLPLVLLLGVNGLWTAFAVLLLMPAVAWHGWYGGFRRALAAPLAIYLFQAIAVSAMAKSIFGMTTKWKGRDV
jgi:cellulose synthase/poly-beta-1,6-N-acetylglucosamine synthase-like glycosyltransferase